MVVRMGIDMGGSGEEDREGKRACCRPSPEPLAVSRI